MSFAKLNDLLSLLLIAMIALACLSWYRMAVPRPLFLKRAGNLMFLALAVELTGLLTRSLALNNNVLYDLFLCAEYDLLLWVVAASRPAWIRAIYLLAVLGNVGFIWCIVDQHGFTLLSSNAILLFSLLLTPLLALELYFQAREGEEPLHRRGAFWFYLGNLLYFVGLVPLVSGVRLLYDRDPSLAASMWMVIPVLASIRYALYAWANCIAGQAGHR